MVKHGSEIIYFFFLHSSLKYVNINHRNQENDLDITLILVLYKIMFPILLSIIYLFFSFVFVFVLLFPQSYALYIAGDENATSTDVSKYLAKLSAGVCVNVTITLLILDFILGT